MPQGPDSIPAALTIGGSDPSGAGGIQADLKVFSAFGVYGASVIAAVTCQNSCCVTDIKGLPGDLVERQFRCVTEDIGICSLKTGMLWDAGTVERICLLISGEAIKKVVVDPVIISSSGKRLMDYKGADLLRKELLPLALIVTPNIDEAGLLTGTDVKDMDGMKKAAKKISDLGAANVLVTGGHLEGRAADLFYNGLSFEVLDAPKLGNKEFRGTGCALSAAITAQLAKGSDLFSSIKSAKSYVTHAIKTGFPGLGRGMGILNHEK